MLWQSENGLGHRVLHFGGQEDATEMICMAQRIIERRKEGLAFEFI
jgi:hypothetical protein